MMFLKALIRQQFLKRIFSCIADIKMKLPPNNNQTLSRPPTTSEYLEALQIIRAYLENLGCNGKEMDALLILEGKFYLNLLF